MVRFVVTVAVYLPSLFSSSSLLFASTLCMYISGLVTVTVMVTVSPMSADVLSALAV